MNSSSAINDKENVDVEARRRQMLDKLSQRSTKRVTSIVRKRSSVSEKLPDEAEKLQIDALTGWINGILRPALDVEIENPMEMQLLLKHSKKANNNLQRMLSGAQQLSDNGASMLSLGSIDSENELHTSAVRISLMKRAKTFFQNSTVPSAIENLVASNKLAVREEIKVASNLGTQALLCSLLLNVYPVWLQLALETLFDTQIRLPPNTDSNKYVRIMSSFVQRRILADFSITANSTKLAIGWQRRTLTPAGVQVLHKFFLSKYLTVWYLIESFVGQRFLPNMPCMFWPSSKYKSIKDILAVLSREVLSGASTIKSLYQVGFYPSYQQGFFEEYIYVVHNLQADLSDGIILAKVVEILSAMNGRKLVNLSDKLRNPSGDRLRKVSNVRTVLAECYTHFTRQFSPLNTFNADDIVAGKPSTVIELVWTLIGVFIGDEAIELRREFTKSFIKARHSDDSTVDQLFSIAGAKRLLNAAKKIQRWWRSKYIMLSEKIKLEANELVTINDSEICTSVEAKRRHHAAKRIQRWWKKILLLEPMDSERLMLPVVNNLGTTFDVVDDELLELLDMKRRNSAAKKIQRWWRVCCQNNTVHFVSCDDSNALRTAVDTLNDELLALLEVKRRHSAAKKIQRWWRACCDELRQIGHNDTVSLENIDNSISAITALDDELLALLEVKRRHSAAKKIQRWWRACCDELRQIGHNDTVSLENIDNSISAITALDDELLALLEVKRRHSAAKKIQRWWRACCDELRQIGHNDTVSLENIDNSISAITALDDELLALLEVKRRHSAAKKIQRWWRACCDELRQIDHNDTAGISATTAAANGSNRCHQYYSSVLSRDDELREIIEDKRLNISARKIQRWWRSLKNDNLEVLKQLRCEVFDFAHKSSIYHRALSTSARTPSLMVSSRLDYFLRYLRDQLLVQREMAVIKLEQYAVKDPVNVDYLVERGGIMPLMICSMELMNRSFAHLLVLQSMSRLLLVIVKTLPKNSRYVAEHLNELVREMVKQIFANYKEKPIVKFNTEVLETLKTYDGFRTALMKCNFPWYLKQIKKRFNMFGPSDLRSLLLKNVLTKLEE